MIQKLRTIGRNTYKVKPFYWWLDSTWYGDPLEIRHEHTPAKVGYLFQRKTALFSQKIRANRNYYSLRLNRWNVEYFTHRRATSNQYTFDQRQFLTFKK